MAGKWGEGQPFRGGEIYGERSTDIPLSLLQDLKPRAPYPVTVGGSSNVTFTLNASVTHPVGLWIGRDYVLLKTSKAYTWVSGSNTVLNSSGATATQTNSATGVWYFYVGIDADNETLLMYPSQTAPSYVEHRFGSGIYAHPGTSRTMPWAYVGYHVCTTADLAFLATKKVGRTYHFASQSVATTASWAALDFTAYVPAIEGIQVAGKLETGAAGTVAVSGSSVEDQGVLIHDVSGHVDNDVGIAPFGPIETDGSGQVYAKDTVARGDVHISQVVDVV